jgi:TPR repeat protein
MNAVTNKRKTIADLKREARAGDGASARMLGDRYRDGDGVTQNWEEAFRWYSLGASAGNAECQNNIGSMYLNGTYTPADVTQATYWYAKSAAQGNLVAQYNLAIRHLNGDGMPLDFAEAMRLLKASADQGYAFAWNDLGAMHLQGNGTPRDLIKATECFIEAAERRDELAVSNLDFISSELEDLAYGSNTDAALLLSDMNIKGLGVPENRALGWAWMLWAEECERTSGECWKYMVMISQHGSGLFFLGHEGLQEASRLFAAIQQRSGATSGSIPPAAASEGSAQFRQELERWHEACNRTAPENQEDRQGELILDLAAEGGGLSLLGIRVDTDWEFFFEIDDWTPTLLDEPAIHRQSSTVQGWPAALELLNDKASYWHRLYPTFIHPEFRERILQVVERKYVVEYLVSGKGEGQ